MWNPWESGALKLPDLDPTEWHEFIAIETVNAAATSPLVVSPTSVDFGQVPAGGFGLKAVTLKNTGNTSIRIFDVDIRRISGGDSDDFHASPLCPSSLRPGKSCVIFLKFIPDHDHIGANSASLVISYNAAGSPQTVALVATTINPRASFNPRALSFGKQRVGTTSTAQTVTLTNTGSTPLILGTVSIHGDFSISETGTSCAANLSLAPSAKCTVSVQFTPHSKRTRTGTIVITDNALSSPEFVGLSGQGN